MRRSKTTAKALASRWEAVNGAALLLAAALVLFLPFYQRTHASPRPLYANLVRLQPFQAILGAPGNKLLIGDYAGELANYLKYDTDLRSAALLSFRTYDYSVLKQWDRQQPLDGFLAQRGFTAIFVQPRMMAELQTLPAAKALLQGGTAYQRLNSSHDADWGLYVRHPEPAK